MKQPNSVLLAPVAARYTIGKEELDHSKVSIAVVVGLKEAVLTLTLHHDCNILDLGSQMASIR